MSTDSDTTYDVCIVGAGLTGSAAARWTSTHKDIKVCLIGPNEPKEHEWSDPSRTIFGAHYDQGRVVTEVCVNNAHDSWIESTRRSIARFKDLEAESGIHFFKEVRSIMISNESIIKEKWRKCRDKNTAKCFKGDELSNAIPAFKSLPDNVVAIMSSDAGYINPRTYIAANKLLASRYGCEIVEDVVQEVGECHEVDDDDDADEKKLSRRHLIVTTKSGRTIRARRVLLCPGAFVNFENLLPSGLEVDITTTTERVVLLEVHDEDIERLSSFPCGCVDMTDTGEPENCYFLSAMEYPDGKYYLKIGHGSDLNRPLVTPDDVTDWYKRRGNIPTAVQENLMSRFFKWVTGFEPKSVRASTCVITTTPTDRFYCDMATSSLGVLVGGNGSGACVADEMGKMGAQMIAKGAWDHDYPAELFKLRFKVKGKQAKSTST